MATALGAEIKKFYNDGWPKDAIHEDYEESLLDEQGEFTFGDGDQVDLDKLGVIVYSDDKVETFSDVFCPWLKAQTTATIVVEVPKEWVQDILYLLKNRGFTGKVA